MMNKLAKSVVMKACAVALFAALATSACSAGSESAELGAAEGVFVFSVPTLTWADLDRLELDNLNSLLSDSVVADLSVRSVGRRVRPADGYATLNAGTRAEGTETSSLAFVAGTTRLVDEDPDGDPVEVPPEAFEEPQATSGGVISPPSAGEDPGVVVTPSFESFAGTPLTEEFVRRTGVHPEVGEIFNLGFVSMLRNNDRLRFDAEIGALGTALQDSGKSRAVIANADHELGLEPTGFQREAAVGLMDTQGLVDAGRVGRSLLLDSPGAPFGTRYNDVAVSTAFGEFWENSDVVLLEASDVVRAEDAAELATSEQYNRMRDRALLDSDDLLGELLKQVDLERDAVIVVAPWSAGYSNSVTAFGVHAPETAAGLLSTGTTRRAGFAQTVDVAPTILSLLDVDIPTSMEGTPAERKETGGTYDERVDYLTQVSEGAEFRDSSVTLASTLFVIAQLVVWVGAIWVLSRSRRSSGRGLHTFVEVCTLGVLTFLPVTYIAGAFPFHSWGSSAYWAFLIAGSALTAVLAYFPFRRRLIDPLMVVLGFIVVFLSVDIIVGGPLQLNTVFGYTPTVAGRFNGMGNPAFSMFAAAAIMLSSLIAHRVGGKKGAWAGIALLIWIVILDGAPWLGADVGGALALVPSCAVTAWLLLGRKIKAGTVVLWGLAAVVVVFALGLLDLMRPESERTHLGRLLADVAENGPGAFTTVILRKLDSNLSVLVGSVWTLMVPVVFIFVGYIFWRAPWRLRIIAERIPEQRAAVGGLITAMVLGFALNDSGIAVPGIMLGVVSASLVHLMLRIDRDSDGSSDSEDDGAGVPASGESGAQTQGESGEQSVLT